MADLQHTLNNEQRQEQQMSAKQLQSLKLLNFTQMELLEHLNTVLAANPVLEVENISEPLPEQPPESKPEREDESEYGEQAVNADEWREELPLPETAGSADDNADFWLNTAFAGESFQEQLQRELEYSDYPEKLKEIASHIIDSLSDHGYLQTTLADIAMVCDCELAEAETALQLVQSFDPPGIGARDLAECLMLQLKRSGRVTPLLQTLLTDHQEDIARNQLPQLAKKLGISLDELSHNIRILRSLSPYPIMGGGENRQGFIFPEISIVRNDDGDFEVIPRRERMPRIFLAERYLKMLEKPSLSPEDRAYLQEKIKQAQELLRAIELRESTIVRLGKMLITHQADFLEQGAVALHPMTMKQAGEILGVHETTVSRAAAGKYVETPQGIFPLNYFFAAGFVDEDGSEVSSRAVIEKIKELIDAEDPRKPLSDAQLARSLEADGLAVARRTVAKYRESLNIPASSQRKKYL